VSGPEYEQAVAALRREFADALPARVGALRAALDRLREAVTREDLRAFHLPAHALEGTAGAYDAHELVPHATHLALLARAWIAAGRAPSTELEEASHALDALDVAIQRFRRRVSA